ncbi:F0F1 ATP synthase subunit A [bacterium]|nr:F0F1 ATP synthase subunit A [bacterium]
MKQGNTQGASEQVQHEITLFAEPVLKFENFTITNSLLNSFATVLILVLFFIAAGRKIKQIPKGIQNFFEMILEESLTFADTVTGSRKNSKRFLPIVLSLFLFILVNNWLGIFPGIGTIGFVDSHEGHKVFVPFFRGGTADLNTTLALALISIVGSHVFGVITVGAWNYLNRFINIKALLEIPSKFRKAPSVILVNPIKVMVGMIEIVSEIAKVASLSFRLFGNIFAGEVLLVSMMALFAFLLPLPFMFMEILVGFIQALVFAILVLVFFTMATASAEH